MYPMLSPWLSPRFSPMLSPTIFPILLPHSKASFPGKECAHSKQSMAWNHEGFRRARQIGLRKGRRISGQPPETNFTSGPGSRSGSVLSVRTFDLDQEFQVRSICQLQIPGRTSGSRPQGRHHPPHNTDDRRLFRREGMPVSALLRRVVSPATMT